MKTLAFFNVKGGVGKTSSAVNIAYLASQAKVKTLLWDLDPQSCASWYLGIDDDASHKVMNVFKNKTPVGKLRINTPYRKLEVIPGDISLRKLELILSDAEQPRKVLDKFADSLSERNKLLIFDCAPAFSKLSENIFHCSDIIAVPLLPSPLSLRSYKQFLDYVQSKKQWKHLQILPFFTMVDRRRKIHNEVIEDAKKLIGESEPVCIPYSSDLEKMGSYRQPIHRFAPYCPAAKAYATLWRQLEVDYQLQ